MHYLLAAILWIAPHLPSKQAQLYAQLIKVEARRNDVDPLLVVALVHTESRFKERASSLRNYGLMQVRVSKTVHADYLGRERLVLRPEVNIQLGTAMLAFWRSHHRRWCAGRHPWWSHYQHGGRVRDPSSGRRVRTVYLRLRELFSHKEVS